MRALSYSLSLLSLVFANACSSDSKSSLIVPDDIDTPDLSSSSDSTTPDGASPDTSDTDVAPPDTDDVPDTSPPDTDASADIGPDVTDTDSSTPPGTECTTHNDCAPASCQLGRCDNGYCIHVAADDGTTCDDGNACTSADLCAGGVCRGTPLDCDDGNPCTVDTCESSGLCVSRPRECASSNDCHAAACDPSTGECVETALSDGTSCDDGKSCTQLDACLEGECRGVALGCGDGNPCTLDDCEGDMCLHSPLAACDVDTQCEQQPEGIACDDQDPNTVADLCLHGRCAGFTLHRTTPLAGSHTIEKLSPEATGWTAVIQISANNQVFQGLADATRPDFDSFATDTILPPSEHYLKLFPNLYLASNATAFKRTTSGFELDAIWTSFFEDEGLNALRTAYRARASMDLRDETEHLWLGVQTETGPQFHSCSLAEGCTTFPFYINQQFASQSRWIGLLGSPLCEGVGCEEADLLAILEAPAQDIEKTSNFYRNRPEYLDYTFAIQSTTKAHALFSLDGQQRLFAVLNEHFFLMVDPNNPTNIKIRLSDETLTQVVTASVVGTNYLLLTGYRYGENTVEPFIMVGPSTEAAVDGSAWIHHSLGTFPSLQALPMGPRHLAIHPLTGEIRIGGALRVQSVNFPNSYQGAIWTRL